MRLDPAAHPWMRSAAVTRLFSALGTARFVGGAVRNALLGVPVGDIDIATPLTPDRVVDRLEQDAIKVVLTGFTHGTVTAVIEGKPFEITSLRRDVATDGRHAEVAFGEDWRQDARRRDFTMNALYADADGEVFDDVGGLEDLQARRVRFVGDAETRIAEDYLRILRLFRFQAWYGHGEIDADAYRAAVAGRGGLAKLSGERIQKEMLKLLAAVDPVTVLRRMDNGGILDEIALGGIRIARLEQLAEIDRRVGFVPDAGLRLAALLPDLAMLVPRWKLSNALRQRLEAAATAPRIAAALDHREARRMLYLQGVQAFNDRLFLSWADDPGAAHDNAWCALLELADFFAPPRFPLSGRDALAIGVPQGPQVAQVLGEVEAWWIAHDFTADHFALAEKLKAAASRR
jgi:poly(A) polymerase